jgi:putative sigma-54 modulation protein
MRLDITGRHVDVTPHIRQLIEKSLARVARLLNDRLVSTTAILTKEKYRHKTELVVHARGDHMLSAMAEANTWPLSLRKAAAAVEHQAQKLKSTWTEGRYRDRRVPSGSRAAAAASEPGAPARIVRGRYPVKPMSIEDAALRLEGGRETFVVFRNAETDTVGILYRRKDGNLALIEPD